MFRHLALSVVLTALLALGAASAADIQQCSMVVDGEAEVVTFDTLLPDGVEVTVNGLLVKPSGRGPYPAIVMLPGGGSLVTPYCFAFLAKQFVSWGYATMIVASSTARDRSGTRRLQYSFLDQTKHALGAASYLAAHSEVDPHRIGVWGFSRGGLTAIYVASDPNSSVSHFGAAIAIAPHCPAQASAPKIPLLVIQGTDDAIISAEVCVDYANRIQGTFGFEFLLLAGGRHVVWDNDTHAATLAASMRAFLVKYL